MLIYNEFIIILINYCIYVYNDLIIIIIELGYVKINLE